MAYSPRANKSPNDGDGGEKRIILMRTCTRASFGAVSPLALNHGAILIDLSCAPNRTLCGMSGSAAIVLNSLVNERENAGFTLGPDRFARA